MKKAILVAALAMGLYHFISNDVLFDASGDLIDIDNGSVRSFENVGPKASHQFRCDGRQYCSQMTSRAEAKFFNRYCPDTKMDGDHDGFPCENDSRW